jgi:N4-(beta-N-acetylglucosaminyl)-L-asparaginase
MSDSAVAGAGAYAETGVGGCGSTGDGDIHLRFLPCYQACYRSLQWWILLTQE